MSKLKRMLFSAWRKLPEIFAGSGLGKIPGVLAGYKRLHQLLWPYKTILDVQGSKMYLNVHEKSTIMRKTFQSYALNRVHEKSTTALFKKVVKNGDIVVDLGANIGYFTLLAAKIVGKKGKVYSFEPEPRNYYYLRKNIELNHYDNVLVINKAVSDKKGKVELYICPYDSGHHTINQYKGIEEYKPDFVDKKKDAIEVETIVLDDFFNQEIKQPIDVIKMDVEGAEMLALSGMNSLIRESENLKMFVEFFPLLIREMGNSPEEFIRKLLEDYHFSIFVIEHDYSMANYALDKEYLRIDGVKKLMNLCPSKMDHLNLFLEKGGDI